MCAVFTTKREPVPEHLLVKPTLKIYDRCWQAAIPFLRRNRRLAEGVAQRTLNQLPPPADLWIQAASAGEAYLAGSLLAELQARQCPHTVLATSTTRHGMDILKTATAAIRPDARKFAVHLAYFPFDRPALMHRAVAVVRPRAAVLLETEIWPGMFWALKSSDARILIINARLRATSLRHYRLWPALWRQIAPHHVAAVSKADARRYRRLFPDCRVDMMNNIKFDRLAPSPPGPLHENQLPTIFPSGVKLLTLGSVRGAEERLLEKIIAAVFRHCPDTIIALFPRHLQRVGSWRKRLGRLPFPWCLRSQLRGRAAAGSVILWDVFGELPRIYGLSTAVFVGASLRPLGGQNFIEALLGGVIPVIGPWWEHFKWIGPEIVSRGLVKVAADWRQAAALLTQDLKQPFDRNAVHAAAGDYIRQRQGGTQQACDLICRCLA